MSNYDDSFKRIHEIMSETLLPTVQIHKILASSPAFSTAESVSKILEPYRNLGKAFKAAYSNPFSDALNSCMSEPLTKALSASVNRSISNSLKNSPSFQKFSSTLGGITPELKLVSSSHTYDFPKELGGLSECDNDYVVVDKSAVKTYDLPDSVAIPIGNNRIRISTSLLFAIISFILSTGISIASSLVQSNSSQVAQDKQLQVEEAQLEVQRAQYKMLQQLLHNVDTSSSNEAKAIKDLQETVEEQNKQLSEIQDKNPPTGEDLDKTDKANITDTPK